MPWAVLLRLCVLCLFFLCQFELLEVTLRAYYDGPERLQSVWAPIVGSQRFIFSFFFVFLAAFLVVAAPRLKSLFFELLNAAESHGWRSRLLAQCAAYTGFVGTTYLLSVRYQAIGDLAPLVLVAWSLLLCGTAWLACISLAPLSFWRKLTHAHGHLLLIAFTVASAAVGVTLALVRSWPSMIEMTLRFSETLLRLFYDDVVTRPELAVLGTQRFDVEVTAACAGYEGIALIVAFLSLYLWLFRESLRFPSVLLMFPLGIAAMWTFNSIRIAALIAIGSSWSPDIAITGFHSNAGWIAFILVSLGLIGLMHRLPIFAVANTRSMGNAPESVTMARALLLPMIVLLASILLISAGSGEFEWLYPVKVITTGAVLLYFWSTYRFHQPWLRLEPIVIGAAVFLVWMALVPADSARTTQMGSHLSQVTPAVAVVWLIFRFIGSSLVVPLAEELAFRGYLLSRLSRQEPNTSASLAFGWVPFLATSLLFGLVHGDWLAGTIAGMAYALARYRHGRVGDAVLAHMTTNAMLSTYVLVTQQWSYW